MKCSSRVSFINPYKTDMNMETINSSEQSKTIQNHKSNI